MLAACGGRIALESGTPAGDFPDTGDAATADARGADGEANARDARAPIDAGHDSGRDASARFDGGDAGTGWILVGEPIDAGNSVTPPELAIGEDGAPVISYNLAPGAAGADVTFVQRFDGAQWNALGGAAGIPPLAVLDCYALLGIAGNKPTILRGSDDPMSGDLFEYAQSFANGSWSLVGVPFSPAPGVDAFCPVSFAVDSTGRPFMTMQAIEDASLSPHVLMWAGTGWESIGPPSPSLVGALAIDRNDALTVLATAQGQVHVERRAANGPGTWLDIGDPLAEDDGFAISGSSVAVSRDATVTAVALVEHKSGETRAHVFLSSGATWRDLGSFAAPTGYTIDWMAPPRVAFDDTAAPLLALGATATGNQTIRSDIVVGRWNGATWDSFGSVAAPLAGAYVYQTRFAFATAPDGTAMIAFIAQVPIGAPFEVRVERWVPP
jgi:hypothetical protein